MTELITRIRIEYLIKGPALMALDYGLPVVGAIVLVSSVLILGLIISIKRG